MRYKKELLLAALVAVVALCSRGAQGAPGTCIKFDARTRPWWTPSDYDTNDMNLTYCQALCGEASFGYSGVEAGKYCFCSNTKPAGADTVTAATYCTLACQSGTEKCGGQYHISFLQSIAALEDPTLTKMTKVLETNVPVDPLEFSVVGVNEAFLFDFGDGAGYSDACGHTGFKNPDSKVKVKPVWRIPSQEVYNVRYKVTSPSVPTLEAAIGVVVASKVTAFRMQCPTKVARAVDITKSDDEFCCEAKAYAGTGITATINLGDGTTYTNVALADPRISSAGGGVQQYGTCSGAVDNKIYVMPDSEFTSDASITDWEVNMQKAGAVTFLVFEPACSSGSLSYDAYACQAEPGLMCAKSTHDYCTNRGRCTTKTSGACPANPRGTTATFDYKVKHAVAYTATATGYQRFSVGPVSKTSLNVTKGMFIGYASASGGGIVGMSAVTGSRAQSKAHAAVSTGTTITQGQLDTSVTANKRIQLRAIGSTVSTLKVCHQYPNAGMYKVSITMKTTVIAGTVTEERTVTAVQGIDYVFLDLSDHQKTGWLPTLEKNKVETINIKCNLDIPNANYKIDFGDGSTPPAPFSNKKIIQYTYTKTGKFTVSITAENDISKKTNTSEIEVKEKIDSVKITQTDIEVNVPTAIPVVIGTGSGYQCKVDYGDATHETLDETKLPVVTGKLTHTYAKTGQYTLKVDCQNGLDAPGVTSSIIHVNEKLKSIAIIPPGSKEGKPVVVHCETNVVSGEGVTFTASSVPVFKAGVAIDMSACSGKPKCSSTGISGVTAGLKYAVTCTATNRLGSVKTTVVFTIDGPIRDPLLQVKKICNQVTKAPGLDGYYLLAPSCVEIEAYIGSGSNAFASCDFGDGSAVVKKDVTPATNVKLTHDYTKIGTFTCKCTLGNGNTVWRYAFKFKSFKKMDLACDTTTPVKAGVIQIKYNSNGPIPPDTTYTLDYGDSTNQGSKPFDNTPVGHTYLQAGTFAIVAVFSNPVETITLTCNVEIIEPIEEPKSFVLPKAVAIDPVTKAAVEVVVKAQVTRGTGMKITYNFGQSGGEHTVPFLKSPPEPKQFAKESFGTIGTYKFTMTIFNVLNSITMPEYTIHVEHPVRKEDYEFTCNGPLDPSSPTLKCTLKFKGPQKPTSPTHEIFYGHEDDGTEKFDGVADLYAAAKEKKLEKKDLKRGCRTTRVEIYNHASKIVLTADSSVQFKLCDTASIVTKYRPALPLNGVDIVASGHAPADRDVKFFMEFGCGREENVDSYEFSATSVTSDTIVLCDNPNMKFRDPIVQKLPGPGDYDVTITAKNRRGIKTATTKIHLSETCQGMAADDGRLAVKAGVAKSFTVTFTKTGTKTCVAINYGEGSSWELHGAQADCGSADVRGNLKLPKDATTTLVTATVTTTMTFTHTFSNSGPKTFAAIAANYLAVSRTNLSFSIMSATSKVDCERPKIAIFEPKPPEDGQRCPIGEICKVMGKVISFKCSHKKNVKRWEMWSVDNDGNPTVQIDIRGVKGHRGLFLRLPAHFTKLGVYRLTLHVAMTGTKNIKKESLESQVSTYIWITKGRIIVSMFAGGVTSLKIGRTTAGFKLEPGKYMVDTSIKEGDPKPTYRFLWFAQLTTERFVQPDTTLPRPAKPMGAKLGGCFGNGAGLLTLSDTTESFSPDFSQMDYETTCNITVIVIEGDRRGINTMLITVLKGTPPLVTILCVSPNSCMKTRTGQEILLTSDTTKQRANCTLPEPNCPSAADYKSGLAKFRWRLYYLLVTPSYQTFVAVQNDADLTKAVFTASNGEQSVELGLLPKLFDVYPDTTLIRLEVSLTYKGLTGSAEMNLTINRPPYNGTCSVTPTTGTYLETEFKVIGTGWLDDSKIVACEIYIKKPNRNAKFIRRYDECGKDFELTTWLRRGKWDVIVRIIDDDGAFKECVAGTKVKAAKPKKSKADVRKAAEDAITKGNPREVAEALSGTMEDVNEDSADIVGMDGISASPSAEQQAIREEGKKMAMLVVNNREALKDLDTKDCVEVAFQLAENPTLLDRECQEGAVGILEDSLAKVDEDTKAPPEEQMALCSKIICTADNIQTAAMKSKQIRSKWDNKQAEEEAVFDPSSPKDGKPYDGNQYLQEDETVDETNSQLSTDMSDKMSGKLKKITADCQRRVSTLMPPGGIYKFNTDRMDQTYCKLDAESGALPPIVTNDMSVVQFPNFCDMGTPLPGCGDPRNSFTMASRSQKDLSKLAAYTGRGARLPAPFSPQVTLDVCDSDGNAQTIRGPEVQIFIDINCDPGAFAQQPNTAPNMPHGGNTYMTVSFKGDYPPLDDYPGCDIVKAEAFFRLIPDPLDLTKAYFVFFNFDGHVNVSAHKYVAYTAVPKRGKTGQSVPIADEDSADDSYTLTLDARAKLAQQKAENKCTVFIGVREMTVDEAAEFRKTGRSPDVNNETIARWKAVKGNMTANVNMSIYIQSCQYFDENSPKRWRTDGCSVRASKCTRSKVSCECNHMTSFAGGWVVVPNKLDFNYIFANLDPAKNPTVYATLITIFVIYLIGAIICRRADLKDVERACVWPLVDNDPENKYMYEVTVASGMSKGAGTHSKVYFILSGENDETDVRVLHDRDRGNKHVLNRGSIDSFLLTTPRPLGDLNYARIWHDNTGKGKFASWYLKYFLVQDIQTKKKYQFILNRWFAVEEDDGQIDRLIPVAGREQMVEFGHLFSQTSRKNLGDEHLWFSLVGRPPRSRFTRLQRCSCCFQLLVLTMLASAMFYKEDKDGAKPNTNALEIGPFSLSPQQLSVGVMSNLVIFPATFLTVWMFRKSRPKQKRKSRIAEALERNKKGKAGSDTSASVSDVQAEVNKNEEIEMADTFSEKPPPYDEVAINNDLKESTGSSPRPDSPPDSANAEKNIGIPMEDPLIKKKKKKLSLPWYGRHIGWAVLIVSSLTAMAFTFFYGVQFGEVKCKKWITSMMVAFLMSVFITQPIKVFCLALFFSLVLKKADDDAEEDEEDEEQPELQYDEQWLHQPNEQGTFGATKPRTIAYKPPDPAALEKFRANRLKEIKMYSIIKEIISYAFFVWILLSVSYSFRDPDSYTLKQQMVRTFITGNGQNYKKLNTLEGYWNWTRQVLIPALLVDPWYDHETNFAQAYGQRGFIVDRTQRHMGYPVMRQLRAKPHSCVIEKIMEDVIEECVEGYSLFSQEERTFGVGWTEYNETSNNTREEYMYTSANALDGLPYLGDLAMYQGGGYVFRLQGNDKTMQTNAQRLFDEHWLDSHTRAIFVEFTTYNPNTNLFAVCTILTEFPGSTAMVNTFRIEPVNLLGDYHGNGKWYELTCQVLYVAFLIYFMQREIRLLFKERAAYFKHLWNITELLIIGLSIAAIAIYFYRYFVTKGLVTTFKESHGLAYIKFQYVASWNELLLYIVGWLVFLANLKFLRLLRFNKRMAVLGSVLRYCRKDLFAFAIMFSIIFFAFVQFFYLLFLRDLVGYKSFITSAETSMNIMLGKFDFKAMLEASPILAPIFFFLFVLAIVMILINMFLSILNESFTIVKNDVSQQSNDYEMVDFILGRFKAWTGIGGNDQHELPPDVPLNNQREGLNGVPPHFEMQIDNFPDKIDKLLNSISKVYFDHDRIDALLDPSKMGADGKATMKMMMKNQQQQDSEKDNQARAAAFKNIHVPMPDVEDVEK